MPLSSKLKQYVPYPSRISIKKREVQITANHDRVRSFLIRLNNISQTYRGLLGVLAALLFLVNWKIHFTPSWVGPAVWITIIISGLLAAIRIRVIVEAETATVGISASGATVTTDENGSS